MKTFLVTIFSFLLFSTIVSAQVIGKWKTIDDETNKVKSIVEIYEIDGKIYGKIIKLFKEPSEDQDPICDKCEGALHNKKIIGMNIITGLVKDGDEYEGDDGILDPAKGTVYDCKIWVDEDDSNKLNVRGYIGFIYRTQYWFRVK
ncbi:MAG: DUF2147 domain-containing protein [Bacteroidetes bacterium]|nr:MAG: DUF2147 domain-containing protein [Bacteroidota bacterium]